MGIHLRGLLSENIDMKPAKRISHIHSGLFTSSMGFFALLLLFMPLFHLAADQNNEPIDIEKLLDRRGDPGFFAELTSVYRGMEDPAKALDLMYRFLPVIDNDEDRHTLLLDMARLEEQTGKLQKAQLHYQTAAFTGGGGQDYQALFHSMLLLIDLGNLEHALVQAEQIIAEESKGDLYLRAKAQKGRILQLQGRNTEALATTDQLFTHIESLPADVLYNLWILYASLPSGHSRSAAADDLKAELKKRFPSSPEYGLIIDKNSPVATVETALGLRKAEEKGAEQPQTDGETDSDSQSDDGDTGGEKSTAIQAGSFKDAENAMYMKRALEEKGFDAMVSQADVEDVIYYRVLIPIPFGKTAEEIVMQLKEKGFEGYPIY